MLVGHGDFQTSSLCGQLDRPIYYPSSRRLGTYIRWSADRGPVSFEDAVNQARTLRVGSGRPVVLVASSALPPGGGDVKLLGALTNSVVDDERYYVYLLPANP